EDQARIVGTTRPQHSVTLETVHLHYDFANDDELRFTRDPGHVSDFPRTALGIQPARANHDHGAFDGGRNHWRRSVWLHLRSLGAKAFHGRSAPVRDCCRAAMGVCAFARTFSPGSVPASVHGAGRVGNHPGAPIGTVARLSTRIPAWLCLSMRR